MRKALSHVLDRFDSHRVQRPDRAVARDADPGELRRHLADRFQLDRPRPLRELIDDVTEMLDRWSIDVTHPRYFGLFNPSVRPAGVTADLVTALYNPQLAVWSHAPAANEIEQFVIRHLLESFGFDPEDGIGTFTTGGSEANLTAVTAALTERFPAYGTDGLRALPERPVLYASRAAHDSFGKICHLVGIGRDSLRRVELDARMRMDAEALRRRIEKDLSGGRAPFMVIATAGTTSAGVVDPIVELVETCRRHGLWLHVDAAWGGAAMLSPRLRQSLGPIAEADSVTCDAHKWFSVPMGAGIFLGRRRRPVEAAFRIHADYMPDSTEGVVEPYRTSVQWSRRFTGLKVFMVLAELGAEGFARMIEHQAAMGESLRERLLERGWEIVNETPLPVVCCTHPDLRGDRTRVQAVVDRVCRGGRAWISATRLADETVIRACITSYSTQESDLEILLRELQDALVQAHSA